MTDYDGAATSSSTLIDRVWLKSISGILKVAELALDLTVFICACVWEDRFKNIGGIWCQIVSITALILTLVLFCIYVFGTQPKFASVLPAKTPWELCELVFNGGYSVAYLVTGIVAAVFGGRHASIAAASFFCFAAMIAYGIDAGFWFLKWRQMEPNTGTSDMRAAGPADPPKY